MTAGGYFSRALAVDASSGTPQTLDLPDEVHGERYDPVGVCRMCVVDVTAGAMGSPLPAPPWSLPRPDRFQAPVTGLGGYSARATGRRIR